MDRISKIIAFILTLALIAFSLFLVVNWKYVSNPYLVPYYNGSRSIFGHGFDDLAKYRNELFYIPAKVITYLIIIETILLLNLRFKTTLILHKVVYFIVFFTFIIISFICPFYEIYSIGFIFWIYVLLSSSVMVFLKKYKLYRCFLYLNIATAIMHFIFLYSYIKFFFD